jgi:MFS family permease
VILWGFVVGAGSGMAATVLGAAVANRWFTEKRGLVMGLLTASTATGQLIFLPALASAVTASNNWRVAPWIVTGATLLAIPVIGWLMRDDPREVGLRPYGETGPVERAAPVVTVNPAKRAVQTLFEAMRVRDFWRRRSTAASPRCARRACSR